MKIRNKLKPKVIDEIIELRNSREQVFELLTNFIENVNVRYDFIHTFLKDNKSKDKTNSHSIKVATGLYLSSLVSCWETFFRDAIVLLIEVDKTIKERVLNFFTEKGILEDEIKRTGISIGEFMSKQFNLQDLYDTNQAFNFLFNDNKNSITEYVFATFSREIIFSYPNYILYWLQQKDDIPVRLAETFQQAFNIRHKVIHDANFLMDINVDFMTKVEDCFILFPQFVSLWISEKYDQKLLVINKENGAFRLTEKLDSKESLFMFSRKDFEAEYIEVD